MERKEKLVRVLQILQTTDKKTPINSTQIREKLDKEFGIGDVDRRTIYKDIALLTTCGYDIKAAENKKQGWYYEKHIFSDWETKMMIDTVRQAKCISEKEAAGIIRRLLSLSSNRGRLRLSSIFMPKSRNSKDKDKIGQYIELVLEAMYIHKKIEFQYTEINNKMQRVYRRDGKKYVFNLYAIYWSDNNYYLIGMHDNHDCLTHYRMDRMENVVISDEDEIQAKERMGPNTDCIIQEYIDKCVNHFIGDKIRISVEYEANQTTNAILYDFVDKSVIVKKIKDNIYQATFTKMKSVTLIGWFLEFSNYFTVVEPSELREEIIERINQAMNMYKK